MDSTPTRADDYAAVLTLLGESMPMTPLTLDEIIARLKWSNHYTNGILCDLRLKGQIAMEEVRVRGRKVKKYTLKQRS